MEKGIYLTEDGSHSIFSEKFGESYHSRHGAIQESQHVFINAGLAAMQHLEQVHILEMGFGTGLNAFLTYLHIKNKGQKPIIWDLKPIHFPSIKSRNSIILTNWERLLSRISFSNCINVLGKNLSK